MSATELKAETMPAVEAGTTPQTWDDLIAALRAEPGLTHLVAGAHEARDAGADLVEYAAKALAAGGKSPQEPRPQAEAWDAAMAAHEQAAAVETAAIRAAAAEWRPEAPLPDAHPLKAAVWAATVAERASEAAVFFTAPPTFAAFVTKLDMVCAYADDCLSLDNRTDARAFKAEGPDRWPGTAERAAIKAIARSKRPLRKAGEIPGLIRELAAVTVYEDAIGELFDPAEQAHIERAIAAFASDLFPARLAVGLAALYVDARRLAGEDVSEAFYPPVDCYSLGLPGSLKAHAERLSLLSCDINDTTPEGRAESERLAHAAGAVERRAATLPCKTTADAAFKVRFILQGLEDGETGYEGAVGAQVLEYLGSLGPAPLSPDQELLACVEDYRKAEILSDYLVGNTIGGTPWGHAKALNDAATADAVRLRDHSRTLRATTREGLRAKALMALWWMPTTDNDGYDATDQKLLRSLIADVIGLPAIDMTAMELCDWRIANGWFPGDDFVVPGVEPWMLARDPAYQPGPSSRAATCSIEVSAERAWNQARDATHAAFAAHETTHSDEDFDALCEAQQKWEAITPPNLEALVEVMGYSLAHFGPLDMTWHDVSDPRAMRDLLDSRDPAEIIAARTYMHLLRMTGSASPALQTPPVEALYPAFQMPTPEEAPSGAALKAAWEAHHQRAQQVSA